MRKTLEEQVAGLNIIIAALADAPNLVELSPEAQADLSKASLRLELAKAQAENRHLQNEKARKAEKKAEKSHVAKVVQLNLVGKEEAQKATKTTPKGATLPAIEVEPSQWVEVTPKQSVRLYGKRNGKSYDRTFTIGELVEYDSWNLSYLGHITNIGPKTVTVQDRHGGESRRLKLYTFNWRNWNLDLEETARRNHETMMVI